MNGKATSQDANQPQPSPPDGESLIMWPIVCVLAWTLGIVAVAPTVWVNPMIDVEGIGNRALVENLSLSPSTYTTRGTAAENLPFDVYQANVYPQPPGYFAVLKVFADSAGAANKENEMRRTAACQSAAYLLHAVALFVYIAAVARWCRAQGYGVIPSGLAIVTIAVCPILVASTVWLRAEGIAAYLGIAALLLLTASDESHWSIGVAAGIIGGFALLTHTSALWIVPLAGLTYVLTFNQVRHEKIRAYSLRPLWIFLAIALAMSGWHYIRLLAANGPSEIFRLYGSPADEAPAADDSLAVGMFRITFRRPAWQLIPEWLATAPVVVALLAVVPQMRAMLAGDKKDRRVGDNWIIMTVLAIFVDFSLRWLWGGCYQLRFCSLWAAMLAPAMVACYVRCSVPWRSWAGGLAVLTLFFQIAGCIPAATLIAEPAYVTPAPAYMLRPWLQRYPPISKITPQEAAGQP